MGDLSDNRLSQGLIAILKDGQDGGGDSKTLRIVFVHSEKLAPSRKIVPFDSGHLEDRNRGITDQLSQMLKDAECELRGCHSSYFYTFATIFCPKGFDIPRLASVVKPELFSKVWNNDAYTVAVDSSIRTLKVDQLRLRSKLDGKEIKWAIVDTGIQTTHPDINNRVVHEEDFTNSNRSDADGHGTHVAGIISQLAPSIELVNLKVMSKRNENIPNTDYIVQALERLSSGSVYVDGVNISLQTEKYKPIHWCSGDCPICVEVDRLVSLGKIVCVAAGNREGLRTVTCPGRSKEAITVGACHKSDPETYGVYYESAGGPTLDGRDKPDLVAPGVGIESSSIQFANGGQFREQQSGTSMATAFASGVCALLLQSRKRGRRSCDPRLIKAILVGTAVSLGREKHVQGSGIIDAKAAKERSDKVP